MNSGADLQPIHRMWSIRGGRRIANAIVRSADYRRRSVASRVVGATGLVGRHPIPTFWSHANQNFGDMLSPVVLGHLTGHTPTLVTAQCREKMLAIGSIITKSKPGDVVWGSGAMHAKRVTLPPYVRVLAVRGPLTREQVEGDVPEIYGDPAILLPLLYRPRPLSRYSVGVVPHFVDRSLVDDEDPQINVIDVLRPWRDVVDEIAACDVIVSSSLHGIIVAEAYGVPATWSKMSDNVIGDGFKFRDYYASTDRDPVAPSDWSNGLGVAVSRALPPKPFDTGPLTKALNDYQMEW